MEECFDIPSLEQRSPASASCCRAFKAEIRSAEVSLRRRVVAEQQEKQQEVDEQYENVMAGHFYGDAYADAFHAPDAWLGNRQEHPSTGDCRGTCVKYTASNTETARTTPKQTS